MIADSGVIGLSIEHNPVYPVFGQTRIKSEHSTQSPFPTSDIAIPATELPSMFGRAISMMIAPRESVTNNGSAKKGDTEVIIPAQLKRERK